MNKNLTDITYVLDRSGSMASLTEAAISGFNAFVADQLDSPGEAILSLALFDDVYKTPFKAVPIQDVEELTTNTFVPRGITALLDAIGRTIAAIDKRLAAQSEDSRPGQIIVAIFTDGLENASEKFTLREINKLIRKKQDKEGWTFLFLAANQDAIATAASYGIHECTSSSVVADAKGMSDSFKSTSRYMKKIRASSINPDAVSEDEGKGLSDIMNEEQRNI